MANPVMLDNVAHADLRVAVRYAAEHGDAVNQAVILPTELEQAQRDYPIVLRPDGAGGYKMLAILGLDRDENLFLAGAGGWNARHIPLLHQRGPFLIGFRETSAGGAATREPMVHVDLDDPRVGDEGLALFRDHGGHSAYLDHVSKLLRAIHAGIAAQPAMVAAWAAADLIAPLDIELRLSETESIEMPDCHGVALERLASLDGARLEALARSGFLPHAVFLAGSLGNMPRLIEMKNRLRGAAGG